MKKTHSELPKNEPVSVFKEGWCRIREGGVACVRVEGTV